jgi:hypothetical protein
MREIQFGAISDIEYDGEVVRVGGRCYEGPIRVGDEFDRIQSHADSGETAPAKLRVTAISLMGKPIPIVTHTYTATLTLTGDGTDRVTDGSVLIGAAPDDTRNDDATPQESPIDPATVSRVSWPKGRLTTSSIRSRDYGSRIGASRDVEAALRH